MGPYHETPAGNRYLLVVTDIFSKWVEAFPLPRATAKASVRLMEEEVFCRWGYPKSVISDNGTQFTSEAFQNACRRWKTRHWRTAVFHQRANPTERKNQDLKKLMRVLIQDSPGRPWDETIPKGLFNLRRRRNAATGQSPSELLMGFEITRPGHWDADERSGHWDADERPVQTTAEERQRFALQQMDDYRQRYDGGDRQPATYEVGDKTVISIPHASVSPDRPGADVDEPELEETPHGQTTNSEGGSERTTAKFRPSRRIGSRAAAAVSGLAAPPTVVIFNTSVGAPPTGAELRGVCRQLAKNRLIRAISKEQLCSVFCDGWRQPIRCPDGVQKTVKKYKRLLKIPLSITPAGRPEMPVEVSDFRRLVRLLDSLKVQYHTFTLPEEKTLRVVTRGIAVGVASQEADEPKRPAKVFEVKTLCGLSVKVEKPHKRKDAAQCHRCQRFHHSQRHCRAEHRCVKCGVDHQTSDCEKQRRQPAKYANCSGPHPASYKGCPKFPKPQQQKASKQPSTSSKTIAPRTAAPKRGAPPKATPKPKPAPVPKKVALTARQQVDLQLQKSQLMTAIAAAKDSQSMAEKMAAFLPLLFKN
ncbi:hypothetical protein Zmor_001516 [Zophobas morio]|uniref:Integrase catalytic domain-containing protein n=1 Tax=Zophobas morio TaxID=2755281 RepID=A0AA38J2S6_9CUCU|nr:hypothetical protein Zmor_001516 [Zophobas morio]